MTNEAISQELKRVRELKRALSSEIELLRTDMENGKIHIRVNQDENFQKELSKRMIEISSLGYNGDVQGYYVCDPVEGKIYYKSNGNFPQYSEDIEYRIVTIEECFHDYNDYTLDIDWVERIKEKSEYTQIMKEYLDEYEDFDKEEFVSWVKDNYLELIQEIEEEEEEEAISFAYNNIKDEIVIYL